MTLLKRIIFVSLAFLFVVGLVIIPVYAQDGERTFDNGYKVRGEFLRFYDSADDPGLIFGSPISAEIVDAKTGITTQYFSRARMELVNGAVQLAPLGRQFYKSGAALAVVPNAATACRTFPTTGNSVCYAFLQFYDAHQGAIFFGNPISNLEISDGQRYIQYFTNVRMEWRPEYPAGERVSLTELGTLDYQTKGNPTLNGDLEAPLLLANGLQAHAFVTQALAPANSQQTLYVIVQNADYEPVVGATAIVTVYYPDGRRDDVRVPTTDTNGISRIQFTVRDLQIKEVVRVDVNVSYQSANTHTASWFRIWW